MGQGEKHVNQKLGLNFLFAIIVLYNACINTTINLLSKISTDQYHVDQYLFFMSQNHLTTKWLKSQFANP